MNLGRLHSETRRCKSVQGFLHGIGVVVVFLSLLSFTSLSAITSVVQETGLHSQEKIQASSHGTSKSDHPILVRLEVEEIEESKEEKKDGPTELFTFRSPSCIAANEHEFSEDDILVGDTSVPTPKAPLYLLFQKLRIPIS